VCGVINKIKYKFSIRFAVLSVFILTNILIASVALGLQYYFSKQMATDSAFTYYDTAASHTASYLEQLDRQATQSTTSLAQFPNITDKQWIGADTQQLFAHMMQGTPSFYSVFIGFENGDLYQLINLASSPEVRLNFNAAPTDRWLVMAIADSDGKRQRITSYYDADFSLRISHSKTSEYDVKSRPWFAQAPLDGVFKTAPYLFKSLQAPGQTYSALIPGTQHVIAIDIALSSLSTYLQRQRLGGAGEIYIYRPSGEIIATNQQGKLEKSLAKISQIALSQSQQQLIQDISPLRVSNSSDWSPIDFSISGKPQGYAMDIMSIVAAKTGLDFEYVNGRTWPQLLSMYQDNKIDVLPAVYLNDENKALGLLSEVVLNLPLGLITRGEQATISSLDQLSGKTLAITQGWSVRKFIRTHYPDITLVEVPLLKNVFEQVRNGQVFAGIDSKLILEHTAKQFFIDDITFHGPLQFTPFELPNSLHMLTKNKQLLAILNLAIDSIEPQVKQELDRKWGVTAPQQALEKSQGVVPYQRLIEVVDMPQYHGKLTVHEIAGTSYFIYIKPLKGKNINDMFAVIVPIERVLGDSLSEITWSIVITACCLLLMLLLSWIFVSPIINPIRHLSQQNDKIKQRKFDEIHYTQSNIVELAQLSQSIIEMSKSIQQHEQAQQELLDAFIEIISQSIDDKSRYTGGHCARVPDLAMDLAQAASEQKTGHFAHFRFKDEHEVREFRIASWLHDCGKITTPVHIVDKGTKLEVIYNRIHEIRMRFEVLWRDVEIEYLKQAALSPARQEHFSRCRHDNHNKLRDDFSFIAQCNVGGEFMGQQDIERLRNLGETTWHRYFDDRLGLSPIEEARCDMAPQSLPVAEPLLSDKAQHVIKRANKVEFPPEFNINMEVPEDISNQGEIYNLSIGRGTLTKEDRYIINEHIISTIKMLEQLPLPPELARVPRYASTHHETLKGTGYPRKLSAKDLSVPERVMVVADVFEALTATDRPYKKAKPVSVAIDILHKMALDQHIDIEVFELLLTSGIYLQYAEKYLPAQQNDAVDIRQYIRDECREPTPL